MFYSVFYTCNLSQDPAYLQAKVCQNGRLFVSNFNKNHLKINIWSKWNLELRSRSIFKQVFHFLVTFLTSFWNPKSFPKHPKWLSPLPEVPRMSTMARKASFDAPNVSQRAFNWSPKRLTTSSDTAFRRHAANAFTLATVSNLPQQSDCQSAEFAWCEWTERSVFAIADEQSNEIKICYVGTT